MKWAIEKQNLGERAIRILYFDERGSQISFRSFVELCRDDSDSGKQFRKFHCKTLRDIPWVAYKWETPKVTEENLDRLFEFVALAAPGLDRRENDLPFKEQFDRIRSLSNANGITPSTVTFENLGRNAMLVVPLRSSLADANHCHLASYMRSCSESESDQLWQAVGVAMQNRIGTSPVWLSTAGGGVAWLHIRLDDVPKYYGHHAYKSE